MFHSDSVDLLHSICRNERELPLKASLAEETILGYFLKKFRPDEPIIDGES